MSRHDSKKECKKNKDENYFENLKVKNLHVKQFCAQNGKIKELKATNIFTTNIETDTLILNGADIGCLLGRPPVVIATNEYDCMDCTGVPIKPSNINQDVWDVLTCNRNAQQQILQEEFLQGRNEIRCIKQAYGCPIECPPDCPPPATCQPIFEGSISGTTLTVTSIVVNTGSLTVGSSIFSFNTTGSQVASGTIITALGTGTGGVGTYTVNISQTVSSITMRAQIPCPCLASTGQTGCSGTTGDCFGQVPANCIPDYDTCPFDVPNNLYRTLTVPFVFRSENPCGGVNNVGFPFAGSRFVSNMSYNLDITNVTCNLGTRVATVMVHFAYQDGGSTGTTGVSGPTGLCPILPCVSCPGVSEPEGLTCAIEDPSIVGCVNLSPEVICGIVRVNCRQYYYTINTNLGESFSNVINIPTEIIQAMINATPLPLDACNITGAFQLAIFIEEGLEVSNNQGTRGGGGNSSGNPTTQLVGCFNAEAKISMANGEFKEAKDILVGDEIMSTNGDSTVVIGRYVQGSGLKELVKINDLIISQPHRVMYENKWIKPISYPGAQLINSEIPVYNFITENSRPFIVEGIIASSIGQFCEGSHDFSNPLHQLWGSDKIVELFQIHPQWPNIEISNDDVFLSMIKNVDFAIEYLKQNSSTIGVNILENSLKISAF